MAAVENIRAQTDKASNAKKPSVTPLATVPRRPSQPRRVDPIPTLVVHTEPARPPQPSPPPPPSSQSRKISFCPQCGTRAAIDSKFCAQCGIAIKQIGGAIARTE
jgi:hypothetical protein